MHVFMCISISMCTHVYVCVYIVSSKVFCYLGHYHVMMIKQAQLLIIWI